MKNRVLISLLGILILTTLSCNLPSTAVNAQTAVAQTVAAQLTQSTAGTTLTSGIPTLSETSTSTITQVFTATITQTPTSTSTITPIPIPCNAAQYVADVTYPDNTEVVTNAGFVKTWRLKNVGSCTWTSSYQLVFSSGDQMGAANAVTLTSGSIAPGGTVDVSISLTAPGSAGTYQGFFKLKAGDGAIFGIGAAANGSFWVQIKAIGPTDVPPVEPPPATLMSDLWISDITLSPAAPKKNQVTHVRVSVVNEGPGTATGFNVKWWGLSTFSSPSCSWDTGLTYSPGGGHVLECDFTYISIYPPNLQTKAVVDVNNNISETNEGNNTTLKTIPAVTE